MKEIISDLCYEEAHIALAKNYTPINKKKYTYGVSVPIEIPKVNDKWKHRYHFTDLKPVPKITSSLENFFGLDNDYERYVDLIRGPVIVTTNAKHIKNHYNNPFSEIRLVKNKKEIYKDGDKLVISFFEGEKIRTYNKKYFLKTFNKTTISIHAKTGNFFIRTDIKTGKDRKIKFRQNNFKMFQNGLHKIIASKYLHTENLFDFINLIGKAFNEILDININLEFKEDSNMRQINEMIINAYLDFFIKIRKIKVPNNYQTLIKTHYPTEYYLKRNNRKLTASILDRNHIKSKLTNKLLNIHSNNLNLFLIIGFYRLFGEDFYKYMAEIDAEKFLTNNANRNYYFLRNKNEINAPISKPEKEAMLAVINDKKQFIQRFTPDYNVLSVLIEAFEDHFNMISQLKEYYPNLTFTPRTKMAFNDEHIRLSRLITKVNKQFTTKFIYSEETIKVIEEDIISFKNKEDKELIVLKPMILKTQDDYQDEGEFMHHCVASYINRDNSIIVSLRTEDNKERVTNEYIIENGICVQSRFFNNAKAPQHFEHGLDILSERIVKLAKVGLLNWKEKTKVPIVINGKEVIKKINVEQQVLPVY